MDNPKVVCLGDGSGCQLWRVTIPGVMLANKFGMDINIVEGGWFNEPILEGADVVLIQRLSDVESFGHMRRMQSNGVRFVYEIDDDMFNLPSTEIKEIKVELDYAKEKFEKSDVKRLRAA